MRVQLTIHMIEPRVLYDSSYRVNISIAPQSSRHIDDAIEKELQKKWEEQLEACRKVGQHMWDGESYRVNTISLEGDTLHIELGPIMWSTRSPIRYADALHERSEDYWGRGAFVSSLIRCKDGQYVFGTRANEALDRSTITTVGGLICKEGPDITSFEDFSRKLEHEIEEELGVPATDILEEQFLGIVYSRRADIGFIYTCTLNLTQEELQATFQHHSDDELEQLLFIPEEELQTFLTSMGCYWELIPSLLST